MPSKAKALELAKKSLSYFDDADRDHHAVVALKALIAVIEDQSEKLNPTPSYCAECCNVSDGWGRGCLSCGRGKMEAPNDEWPEEFRIAWLYVQPVKNWDWMDD